MKKTTLKMRSMFVIQGVVEDTDDGRELCQKTTSWSICAIKKPKRGSGLIISANAKMSSSKFKKRKTRRLERQPTSVAREKKSV